MTAAIHLGCQGWAYPDWVGVFYPPGAKQEHQLPFYSRVFDTVELDNTFYRSPKATLVRSWARQTPADFRFSAKVPRAITHDAALVDVSDAMTGFVRAMEPLEEKLGPLLLQMPASFKRERQSVAALKDFLAALPRELRLAVEFRDDSWHRPETYDLLRERGVCVAWTEWRELKPVREITANFLYLRWLGNRHDIRKYDRVQIDRDVEFEDWGSAIRRAAPVVESMYGYFNNHWAGHSPQSVNELLRRLGRETLDPRSLWPQREIF